jgi:hypothetical protein
MISETQAVNCVKLNMHPDGGIVSQPSKRGIFFCRHPWVPNRLGSACTVTFLPFTPNLRANCLTWHTCLPEGGWFSRRTSTLVWARTSYSLVEVCSPLHRIVAVAHTPQGRIWVMDGRPNEVGKLDIRIGRLSSCKCLVADIISRL